MAKLLGLPATAVVVVAAIAAAPAPEEAKLPTARDCNIVGFTTKALAPATTSAHITTYIRDIAGDASIANVSLLLQVLVL